MRKAAVLPDRCLATGVPTGGNVVTRQLTWIPPWVMIVCVAFSPLIGLVVMLVARKKGALTNFISPQVQAKRRNAVLTGVGLVLGGILALVGGFVFHVGLLPIPGFVMVLVGIYVVGVVAVPFKVSKIDEEHIYLRVKPAFWSAPR